MAAPLIEQVTNQEGKAGLRFNFHEGQLKAWNSDKRIVAIIAGGRSGKTWFGPIWLHREMQRKGPGDYLIAAPNHPIIDKAAGPETQHYFGNLLRLGRLAQGKQTVFNFTPEGAARLWGKAPDRQPRIVFAHAENPEVLEALSAKAAWLDEAGQSRFKQHSWEAVNQRVSYDEGRILLTTKPYNLGWLKTKVYDQWTAANRNHPDIEVVCFDSLMNPGFSREEYERHRQALPKWRFDMTYRGIFTRPSGIIYEAFDAKTHVAKRFPIPDSWPRHLGIDFGERNTAAVKLAGELSAQGAPTGRLIVYAAYHPAKRHDAKLSPKEHVAALLSVERGVPSAVGGAASEDEWRAEFGAAGLYVRQPKIREVEVGIDRVHSCILAGQLLVFSDLEDLIDELQTYSRELNEAGEPTEKIEAKETFHLLDALRYVVSDLKDGSGPWDATPDPAARLEVARAPKGVFIDHGPERNGGDDPDFDRANYGEPGAGESPLYPASW